MPSWVIDFHRAVSHPTLLAYKPARYQIVVRFFGLAFSETHAGIVTLYDDEIAGTFKIPLEAWIDARDEMIDRRHIRRIDHGDERPTYEVTPNLLEMQGTHGQFRDGRSSAPWDGRQEYPRPTVCLSPGFKAHAGSGKMSDAEKNAWSRYNKKRMAAGLNRIGTHSAEHLEWLAERRLGTLSEPGSPSLSGEGNAEGNTKGNRIEGDGVTFSGSVAGNGNIPPTPPSLDSQSQTQQKHNNNPPREAVTVTSKHGEEGNAFVVVVTLLSETGVTLPSGEQVLLSRSKAEDIARRFREDQIRLWMEWLPYYDHDPQKGSWEGMLIAAIEGGWKCPPRYREMKRAEIGREEKKRQAQEAREAAEARKEAEIRRTAGLAALRDSLSEADREELWNAAVAYLDPTSRELYEKRKAAGVDIGKALKGEIYRLEDRVLTEWEAEERAKNQGAQEVDTTEVVSAALAHLNAPVGLEGG